MKRNDYYKSVVVQFLGLDMREHGVYRLGSIGLSCKISWGVVDSQQSYVDKEKLSVEGTWSFLQRATENEQT